MKLQQLIIHNIASIEDATVDFEREPLCEADLFLICGETGAGKSMILDCICLALYGTTPRLSNNPAETRNADKTDEEITVKDARNLLRRNTGEGYVRLRFVGSDGVNYEAEWYVQRARKKRDGKLQPRQWSITDLDSGVTESKRVEGIIREAVGLDFNQFTRTTMLAQGEFTRFLISTDAEKAEILEKITGVNIYSEIGRRIFEGTQERKREWEELNRRIEGAKLLDAEELTRLNTRAGELQELEREGTRLREECAARIGWLAEDARLKVKLEAARIAMESAQSLADAEDCRRMRTLTADWHSTADVRAMVVSGEEAGGEAKVVERELSEAAPRFGQLRGELEKLRREISAAGGEIAEMRRGIAREEANREVYANSQTILAHIESVSGNRTRCAGEEKKIAQGDERLERELLPALEKARGNHEESTAKQSIAEKALVEALTRLEALGLGGVRKRYQSLTTAFSECSMAMRQIEQQKVQQERVDKALETLSQRRSDAERLKGEEGQKVATMEGALKARDAARNTYDRQMDTVDRWAREMRTRLKPGEVCPLCHQEIRAELPSEGMLDEMVEVARKAWERARDAYDAASNNLLKLRADLRGALHLVEVSRNSAAEEQSRLQQGAATLAGMLAGCSLPENVGAEEVDTLRRRLEGELGEVAQAISNGEKIEQEVDGLRKEVEECRRKSEATRLGMEEARNRITGLEGEIEASRRIAATLRESASKGMDAIMELTAGCTLVEVDTPIDLPELSHRIEEGGAAYRKLEENLRAKESLLEKLQEREPQLAAAEARLAEGVPGWEEVAPAEGDGSDAALLESDVKVLLHRLATARTRSAEAAASIKAFLAENPRFAEVEGGETVDYLHRLTAITPQQVKGMEDEVGKRDRILLEKRMALNETLLQREDLDAKRPELAQEDTSELLREQYEQLEETAKGYSRELGTITRQLAEDAEARRDVAHLQEEANGARDLFERWDKLNRLFGDATGGKFRKIAQSYILESLVEVANGYMGMLTPRYTLRVAPGTFIVMVEDGYQGHVCRPASTVSGGESFLVSLALALALSDIGDTLAVDTLFIDEGFGTLSGEPLQAAVATLRSLRRNAGRRVGIISHVEELRERVEVQLRVEKLPELSASRLRLVPESATDASNVKRG